MKNIIKKILKEDRRQMYLNKIINFMKNDFPLFNNLKDYGFYGQLSKKELNYVLSEIFGEPINKIKNSIFNKNGYEIYYETSNGYWYKYEYDDNGNRLYGEYSDGSRKYEYDDNGNNIYEEDSDGFWIKREYNENGKEIYFENSNGFWIKREYDDNGNRIYSENSYGEIIDNR